MLFELSEEHQMIRQAARDFAQQELLPGVIERDNKQEFPAAQIAQMGELGFMGMMVSPQYGGGGMDTVSYVLAMEEISKVDASASVCMSVNNSLVCWGLESFGSEELKQLYLPALASGQKIGAFCLSEPEAGSDATSARNPPETGLNAKRARIQCALTHGHSPPLLVRAPQRPYRRRTRNLGKLSDPL